MSKIKRVTRKPTSREKQIRYAKTKVSFRKQRIRKRLIALGSFVFVLWIAIALVAHFMTPTPSTKTPVSTSKQTTKQQTAPNTSNYPAVTVCVDPGHGGYDSGNIMSDGTYEKNLTLRYAQAFGNELKKLNPNINIVYTRTDDNVSWPSDEVQDLIDRVKIADDANANYFVSFHINSNEKDPSLDNYEFFVRGDDTASIDIANQIHTNLDKAGWKYNYTIQDVASYPLYIVSNQTNRPSLLFEVGYGSNATQAKLLDKQKTINKIAKASAQAYHEYILNHDK